MTQYSRKVGGRLLADFSGRALTISDNIVLLKSLTGFPDELIEFLVAAVRAFVKPICVESMEVSLWAGVIEN